MAGAVTSFLLRLIEPVLAWVLPWIYQPKFASSGWGVDFGVDNVPRDIDIRSMKPFEIANLIVRESLEAQLTYYFDAYLYSNWGTGLRDIVVVFVYDGG